MMKEFCDRCSEELKETGVLFSLERKRGKLCKGCAEGVRYALDGAKMLPAKLLETQPELLNEQTIKWQGERWIKAGSDTIRPVSEFAPPEAREDVPPHRISQAIGAAPVELPNDDPSVGARVVPPAPHPENTDAPIATPPSAHQPFVDPKERDDIWKPGERACEIHACPYRAQPESKRCVDHQVRT